MEIITIIITSISFMVCIILGLYATFNGLDLGNRVSWLIFVISLFFGILLGTGLASLTGRTVNEQLDSGFSMGFILSVAILLQGVIMHRHLKNSKKRDAKIKILYLQLKTAETKNFFTRLAEKILEKFV